MSTPIFEPIKRLDSVSSPVLEQITEAIVIGRLAPGTRLVESHLAEQLGVSRGPVRDALRELEQLGLVERLLHRGAFVSRLTRQELTELITLREPLEGLAARLLAEQRSPDALSPLSDVLAHMEQAARRGDLREIVTLDADFHDQLIESCNHKLLKEIWAPIRFRIRRYLLLRTTHLYRSLDEAVAFHARVVEAIVSGDPQRAETEARLHVNRGMKSFLEDI